MDYSGIMRITGADGAQNNFFPKTKVGLVEGLQDTLDSLGGVKTVNGRKPDASGNVTVDGGYDDTIVKTGIAENKQNISALTQTVNKHTNDIASIFNEIGMMGGGASSSVDLTALTRRIENLEAAANGKLYREEVLDGETLSRNITSDIMPYGFLDSIGGKTVGGNQNAGGQDVKLTNLFNLSNFESQTQSGVTFTKNGDGSITINGRATSSVDKYVRTYTDFNVVKGHKYYLGLWVLDGSSLVELNNKFNTKYATASESVQIGLEDGETMFYFRISKDGMFDNVVVRPKVYDLTATFGLGNEPTLEEFKAMLSGGDQPSGTYGSLNSVRIVSKSVSGDTVQTIDLESIIQKYFPNGMQSDETVHDTLDFENGVAVQNVGSESTTPIASADIDAVRTIRVEAGGTLTIENNLGVAIQNKETLFVRI